MSQTKSLIAALKHELRRQRGACRGAGEALELCETSVKRLFSEETFSTGRPEKICELLQLDIGELLQLTEKNIELTTQLTRDQEKELVSDIKLLPMTIVLMNKLQFAEILEIYDISEPEGIKLLARLKRMKLIELQPGNRVKLMVSRNFEWIPGGPIQRFFEERVQLELLNSCFSGAGEFRLFVSGMISRNTNRELIKKIHQPAQEMNEMNQATESLTPEQRFGASLMMAIRPWEINVFEDLRRSRDTRVFR